MENGTVPRRDEAPNPEICVTVHYADKGLSLEDCMVSILNAHLPKGGESRR